MHPFFHERLHRSDAVMARLQAFNVTICGAGALGANLAETLARAGMGRLVVIDDDRVDARNLSTQPYERADVGASKARLLAHALYRAVGAEVEARPTRLTEANAGRLLGGSRLVVDAFDNSPSRRAVATWCDATATPCLHAGLADGYAEVLWNDGYRVPSPVQDDVCDYPLARTLVLLTVAVAAEVIVAFVATGVRRSYTITLDDLAIHPFA